MKFRMFLLSIAVMMVAGALYASGICEEDTSLVERTLVAPVAFADSANQSVGNYFPWTINTTYFATFRNQYLFPADVFPSEARTVQSISARSVSFLGSQTGVYDTPPGNPAWFKLQVLGYYGGFPGAFGTNFAANRTGATNMVDYINPLSSAYPPFTLAYDPQLEITTAGMGDVSHGMSAFTAIPWDPSPANNPDFVLDSGMDLASSGHSGGVAWDMCQGQGVLRAYGSGSIWNSNWLTQAYGIDDAGFTWVFRGLAAPPPASLDAAIKEIVRLLLTPEALRCSDLDTDVNGAVNDIPVMFPMGKDVDPVSPSVTSGAPLFMEEATNSGLRGRNFRP